MILYNYNSMTIKAQLWHIKLSKETHYWKLNWSTNYIFSSFSSWQVLELILAFGRVSSSAYGLILGFDFILASETVIVEPLPNCQLARTQFIPMQPSTIPWQAIVQPVSQCQTKNNKSVHIHLNMALL